MHNCPKCQNECLCNDGEDAAEGGSDASLYCVHCDPERHWRMLYRLRLIQHGFSETEANMNAQAAEYLEDIQPDEAADDDISYQCGLDRG